MDFDGLFSNFGELTTTGLTQGAIYALVALGYTLVYGVLRLINFAHSEVFIAGAFAAIWTWNGFGLDQNSQVSGLGSILFYLLVAMIVAAIASAGTATVIERVAYRPLRKRNAPPLAFLITAIGASIAHLRGVRRLHPPPAGGRARSWSARKPLFHIVGVPIDAVQLLTVGAALVMMFALDLFINRSRTGRGIRAVAQDANTAALMGVNKDRDHPDGLHRRWLHGRRRAACSTTCGSRRSPTASASCWASRRSPRRCSAVSATCAARSLGGLLLGVVENYAAGLFGSQWKDFAAFAVLVVLLMFRPTGLLGESLGRARA